jgi:hypothetical protein
MGDLPPAQFRLEETTAEVDQLNNRADSRQQVGVVLQKSPTSIPNRRRKWCC